MNSVGQRIGESEWVGGRVRTDSLAGSPCGKGSHRTRGEVFVGNGHSKIRVVHFIINPCEVNCLKGTLGLLIAPCISIM